MAFRIVIVQASPDGKETSAEVKHAVTRTGLMEAILGIENDGDDVVSIKAYYVSDVAGGVFDYE